jgi:hypothetical protein
MLPRDAARLLYDAGWVQVENLTKMLCTVLAESSLFPAAWHWNDPKDGGDGSTDWGIFQLNDGNKGGVAPQVINGMPVPVAKVKAFAEAALDPERAVLKARALYDARGFQPWAAYNRGAWKSYGPTATAGIRNMLHVLNGWPLA